MPGMPAGIVGSQHLNGDDAQAGNRCSVRGPSGHSGCLRDRQDDFEVLEESLTWVRCFVGVGHEVDWESRSLWAIVISQDYLKVLCNNWHQQQSPLEPS